MGVFEKTFDEPIHFTECMTVISRECYSHDEALKIINHDLESRGRNTIKELRPDRIKFVFHGGDIDGYAPNEPCWVTGQQGVGSKKVWVLN